MTDLFEYNRHSNQKLIGLLLRNPNDIPEKTHRLINHLINAHQIWNARITGEPPFEVWQINDWDALPKIDEDNYQATLQILSVRGLDDSISYTNSKGEKYANQVRDVLFHIINHATYHRAQIATDLKEHGTEPLNTNYIFYKRRLEE